MANLIIRTEALTKAYGDKLAVDRLDMSVEAGEVFGLLGPNGSGKTTTILMLLGLTERTSGSVTVVGFDPRDEPLEVKRRVGYMPDQVGFYDDLSGIENLRYTAALAGLEDRQADEAINKSLERVRISYAGHQPVGAYSRGMRQRLAVADILVKGPALAILDEPTAGLDPQGTHEFLELIHTLKKDGMTILLSSHLLEQVQSVCDRVALFNNGRIGLTGRVETLLQDVLGGSHSIHVEATGPNLERAVALVPGVTRVRRDGAVLSIEARGDLRGAISRAIVNAGGDLTMISAGQSSLEDVYTRYFETLARDAQTA